MYKYPSSYRRAAYIAKKGSFPYWTKGFAEYKGGNLWLFIPYKNDHKVIVDAEFLYFY